MAHQQAVIVKFWQLSFLIHPDKNQNDAERAQTAFDST